MTAPAVTHTFASAKSDGADNTFVQPSNWNATHTVLCDSPSLLGRSSTGRGQFESITVDASLALSGGVLAVVGAIGSFALSGTLTRSSLASEAGYSAGNINDYAPTGLTTASTIRLDATSAGQAVTITGIQGGADGRVMSLINVGSTYSVTLVDQSANSQVANRFLLNGNITLTSNKVVTLRYDGSSSVWRPFTPASAGSLGAVNIAGDTMQGALNWAPEVSVASAATTPIGAAASNYVQITGTTTITAFDSIASGAMRLVVFAGALTLTYNATSLILPGAANIATAAGDTAVFISEGSGNWRCLLYWAKSIAPNFLAQANTWTAVQQFTDGDFQLKGATSGTTTLKATAVAGTTTITFPAATDTVLCQGTTATITVGYTVTPFSAGTFSSGTFTPAPASGNYQFATNNGAHTLAAQGSDCAIDILYTNGASAGAITFSGFTVGASTGDALTTVNTNKFLIMIRRINGTATYSIKALQ